MHQQWRKSITTLAFVLASAVSAGVQAQAPKTPLALKPDAPDRYTVVHGDTLWSIAQRYTDSPWRWSELWSLNKDEIKNPNRIYPGNVIVLDVSERRDSLVVLINPEILDASGVSDIEEGCLSVPGIYETLERAERVKVRAYDANGNPFTLEAQGLLAVCIQHEMDHLKGKVFVESLSQLKQQRIRARLAKQLRKSA